MAASFNSSSNSFGVIRLFGVGSLNRLILRVDFIILNFVCLRAGGFGVGVAAAFFGAGEVFSPLVALLLLPRSPPPVFFV